MKRLLNLLRAFVRLPFFLYALARARPVSFETASARLALCSECEELDLLTRQCKKCWCFVRYKVQWEKEKCPEGKWPAIQC
jgi:hypothetical protein